MVLHLKDIEEFFDDGLITQGKRFGGDEGDSCHKTLHFYIGTLLSEGVLDEARSENIYRFVKGGCLVRHPRPDKWVSDWDRGSGDQHTPLYVLWLFGKGRAVQSQMLWSHLGRVGFFTNTRRNGATKCNHGRVYGERDGQPLRYDYTWKVPDFVKLYLLPVIFRSLGWWWFPVYWTLDVFLVAQVLFRRFFGNDDVNNILSCVYGCAFNNASPLSLLALFLIDRSKMRESLIRYWKIDLTDPQHGLEPWFVGALWVDLLERGAWTKYRSRCLSAWLARSVFRLKDSLASL